MRILTDMVLNVMLSSEMYLNWNLDLQVTLLKKRRIDAKLIQTNDLDQIGYCKVLIQLVGWSVILYKILSCLSVKE